MKIALFSAAFALLGSACGARLALFLTDHALRISMLILLPITAVIVLFNKNGLNDDSTFEQLATGRTLALAGAIGFFIGMYDGFFGQVPAHL